MWEESILTEQTIRASSAQNQKPKHTISFYGLVNSQESGIGTYGYGYKQTSSFVSSTISLSLQPLTKKNKIIDDFDLNKQYQRLLEKPLFTKQELVDCTHDIKKLQKQFFIENFDKINVLCQESNWPMHYKNVKPVAYTSYGECYILNNLHLILAKDVERVFEQSDNTCRKILKHKLKGAEALQARCQNEITTPIMFIVDYFGQRVLVSANIVFGKHSIEVIDNKSPHGSKSVTYSKFPLGVTGDVNLKQGDDGRIYIFSSSRVLPPLAPLFACPDQNWLGILYPLSHTKESQIVIVPYIMVNNPQRLLQRVIALLGKAKSNAGHLFLSSGTLVFYRGGNADEINHRVSRQVKREVRGSAIMLPRYIDWNPWKRRFTRNLISKSKFDFLNANGDAFSETIVNGKLVKANITALTHTRLMLSEIVPEVAIKMLSAYKNISNSDLQVKTFLPSDILQDFGLNVYFLGSIRKFVSNKELKREILVEMIARVHRCRINAALKKARCFHDEHIYEDKNRHLAAKDQGSSQWQEIINDIMLPHINQVVVFQFNLLLGHVLNDTNIDSTRYMTRNIKMELWSSFPGCLEKEELSVHHNLYNDSLDDRLRQKLFHLCQDLAGIKFSRKISGKNPLKVEYVENITPKVRYFIPELLLIDSEEKAGDLKKRLKKELSISRKALGDAHESVISKSFSLARILLSTKQNMDAADTLICSLANTVRLVCGRKTSKYSDVIVEYGVLQKVIGNYKKSKQYLEEGMDILNDIGGVNLARCVSALCETVILMGLNAEAQVLVPYCKGVLEEIYGTDGVEVARGYICEALFCFNSSNIFKAKRAVQEAIVIVESCQDTEHPIHAEALAINAEIEYSLGNFEAAIRNNFEALHIFDNKLDIDNPNIVKAHIRTAKYLCFMGQIRKATYHLKLSKISLNRRFSSSHPLCILWIETKALVTMFKGDILSSYLLIREGKIMSKKLFGTNHITHIMGSLIEAVCLGLLGKYNESKHLLFNTVASLNSGLCNKKDALKNIYVTLASILFSTGHYGASLAICETVIEEFKMQNISSTDFGYCIATILLEENRAHFGHFYDSIRNLQRTTSSLKKRIASPFLLIRVYIALSRVYSNVNNDLLSLNYAEIALSIALEVYDGSFYNIIIAKCRLLVANALIQLSSTKYAELVLNDANAQIVYFCEQQCKTRKHILHMNLLFVLTRLAIAISNYEDANHLSSNLLDIARETFGPKYVKSFYHFLTQYLTKLLQKLSCCRGFFIRL
jgi:tetratricopeptide (TPR) repeat protein